MNMGCSVLGVVSWRQLDSTGARARRDHWEGWLVALAASGSEQQFQRAIRRLLAGVESIPITDRNSRHSAATLDRQCMEKSGSPPIGR